MGDAISVDKDSPKYPCPVRWPNRKDDDDALTDFDWGTNLELVKILKVYEHLGTHEADYITLQAKEKNADDSGTIKTYEAKVGSSATKLMLFRPAREKSPETRITYLGMK